MIRVDLEYLFVFKANRLPWGTDICETWLSRMFMSTKVFALQLSSGAISDTDPPGGFEH